MAAYSPVPGSDDASSPTEPLVATPRASPRATGAPAAAEATPPTTPSDVTQAAEATPCKVYPPASPGGGGAPKRFLAFSTGPRQVRLSAFFTLPVCLPLPYPYHYSTRIR